MSLVINVPGLRLVSLTNGAQFARFETARIRKHQHDELDKWVLSRSLRCPLSAPLDVTIVRRAPARMDSDNAVASAKYVRDWLAKWIGINDRHDDLVSYDVIQEKTSRKDPPSQVYSVRIEVRRRVGASLGRLEATRV